MPYDYLGCPRCGEIIKSYRNPFPTVDVIIEIDGGIVLIKRKNEPLGWALPGGFVDYGEMLEDAAIRESREETSLAISNLRLIGCYSDPARDQRLHAISTVYAASGAGEPRADDDDVILPLVRGVHKLHGEAVVVPFLLYGTRRYLGI